MSAPIPNLQLSEILQGLVDCGELSEGSDDYRLAQKVVREGFEALSGEERAAFRTAWNHGWRSPADRPPMEGRKTQRLAEARRRSRRPTS